MSCLDVALRLHLGEEPALVCYYLPGVFVLFLCPVQQFLDVRMAGLAHAVEFNEGAQGPEIDSKSGKKPEERGFHNGKKIRDAIFHTHLHDRLHQPQGDKGG